MSWKDNAETPHKRKKLNNFFYDFVKITGALPAWLLLRPKIITTGKSKPQKIKGGALIVANHISFLDPISVLLAFWRRRIRFLATKDLYKGRFMRFMFRNIHCIMVDKENFSVDTLHTAVEALQSGQLVAIFPEGKVNLDDTSHILPFKTGAVMMANQGNAPIIPVCLIPKKHKFSRQVIVMGESIRIQDICGENPPYRELKKVSVYLRDKEVELMRFYQEKYAKKK